MSAASAAISAGDWRVTIQERGTSGAPPHSCHSGLPLAAARIDQQALSSSAPSPAPTAICTAPMIDEAVPATAPIGVIAMVLTSTRGTTAALNPGSVDRCSCTHARETLARSAAMV